MTDPREHKGLKTDQMSQRTSIPILDQRLRTSAATAFDTIRIPGPGTDAAGARSLYMHVPFCFHKCHYCDFYSIVDTQDRQESFLTRLESELAAVAPWTGGEPLKTIFVGGGTPSLLRVDLWARLLNRMEDLLDLSLVKSGAGEFTVECNPETVTPELMDVLAKGGVSRVSVGAQSFNPRHLKTLERWHDPANVALAVRLAREAGIVRQSVDLIFGIPGQSLEDWREDLRRALDLGTEHVSCYNLTYEPQTAMTARLRRGEFTPADEDVEVEMFAVTLSTLRAHGFDRYEVSNFCKPGCECRHNMAYWRQEDWLAVGPSASSHVGGHRWKNVPRLDDYLNFNDRGFTGVVDHEPPDAKRALAESIMTGLRLREGLRAVEVLARAKALGGAGRDLAGALRASCDRALAAGHLAESGGRWCLTDAGFLLADGIAGEFMAALD